MQTGASSQLRTAAHRFYVPELDFLRFVAFLMVFAFHTRNYPAYAKFPAAIKSLMLTIESAGSFGVDLFFALSGYLITELLLREETSTGNINIRAFYLRRILRIWPLYFFFLALAAALTRVDPDQHFGLKYLAPFTLLSGNWAVILFGVPDSVANPLWSISMEEQFYLCWAPLVKRLTARNLAAAAIVMLLVANLTRVFLYFFHATNEAIWFNTFTRLDPIAAGIFLQVLLRTQRVRPNGLQRMWLLCGAGMIFVLVAHYAQPNANDQPLSLAALIGYPAVALSCFAVLRAFWGWNAALVRNPLLVYLGKISYGLYVYHPLGLWFTEKLFHIFRMPFPPLIGPFTGLCLTIVFAFVSYRILESPFLRLKGRFTKVSSRPV
jgi:peptidoglycan/LPS O-acetylase OafA/YrhL